MPIGSNYAFIQYSDSAITTLTTAGATITFSTSAQTDPAVRIQNLSTATVWIGIGSRSTSSAAVTTKGIAVQPTNQVGCIQIIRGAGNATLAAFTVGATQTTSILTTGGEGLL